MTATAEKTSKSSDIEGSDGATRRDRSRIRPLSRRRQGGRRQPRRPACLDRRRRAADRLRSRQSGEVARTLPRAGDAGTAFDGKHLWQIAETRIDKIDPATGDVVASIPAPGSGSDSGLAWADGSLWVGQYRDRKIHRIDPKTGRGAAHDRIEPLRDRRDVGRGRAVARHLGRRRERDPPHRPRERRRARPARDAEGHRSSAASSPTAPICSTRAAAAAARSAPCAAPRPSHRDPSIDPHFQEQLHHEHRHR